MTATTDEQRRATRPPLEGLRRESPFQLRAVDGGESDGLTLDGYAAVFNRETVIDSWEGRFRERIAPGAMKKSFRENPPRIQFDHGQHPLIGSIPIAALRSIAEEIDPVLAPEGGAHVIARLHDNWLVQPVRDAIASDPPSIDGMSFRFGVIQEQWHDADGKKITDARTLQDLLTRSWMEDLPDEELLLRTLRELRVPELGPVVWPAYFDTSVGVRSLTIDLARLDDPEQRSRLAQAVLMADRADLDDEAPDPTADAAGAHAEESDDPPPITAPAAETHELAARHFARLSRLEQVRHTLKSLDKEIRHG